MLLCNVILNKLKSRPLKCTLNVTLYYQNLFLLTPKAPLYKRLISLSAFCVHLFITDKKTHIVFNF